MPCSCQNPVCTCRLHYQCNEISCRCPTCFILRNQRCRLCGLPLFHEGRFLPGVGEVKCCECFLRVCQIQHGTDNRNLFLPAQQTGCQSQNTNSPESVPSVHRLYPNVSDWGRNFETRTEESSNADSAAMAGKQEHGIRRPSHQPPGSNSSIPQVSGSLLTDNTPCQANSHLNYSRCETTVVLSRPTQTSPGSSASTTSSESCSLSKALEGQLIIYPSKHNQASNLSETALAEKNETAEGSKTSNFEEITNLSDFSWPALDSSDASLMVSPSVSSCEQFEFPDSQKFLKTPTRTLSNLKTKHDKNRTKRKVSFNFEHNIKRTPARNPKTQSENIDTDVDLSSPENSLYSSTPIPKRKEIKLPCSYVPDYNCPRHPSTIKPPFYFSAPTNAARIPPPSSIVNRTAEGFYPFIMRSSSNNGARGNIPNREIPSFTRGSTSTTRPQHPFLNLSQPIPDHPQFSPIPRDNVVQQWLEKLPEVPNSGLQVQGRISPILEESCVVSANQATSRDSSHGSNGGKAKVSPPKENKDSSHKEKKEE